jgi:hypothetical protein
VWWRYDRDVDVDGGMLWLCLCLCEGIHYYWMGASSVAGEVSKREKRYGGQGIEGSEVNSCEWTR